MNEFFKNPETQRGDATLLHQQPHQQTLHLISPSALWWPMCRLWNEPVLSALIAWLVSMTSRQAGHFFFEPKGYDHVNQATHEHKEAIKVGYNLRRKVVLMALWAGTPLLVWAEPGVFGLFEPHTSGTEFIRQVGTLWLALGVGGLLFRTVHLFFIADVKTGLVWMTKILTDPFHDIKLYYRPCT